MSQARKQRGATQNIFLIETVVDDNQFERKFVVMGSTKNVYNVIIKTTPTCSCPDYLTRAKRCKHIYFILIRVMRTFNEDKLEYSNEELLEMFDNIPNIMNNLIIDNTTKQKYDKLKDSLLSKKSNLANQKDTDDLCPICLDDLTNGEELDYCKYSCGRSIHTTCFGMWTVKHPANCLFCKKSWTNNENKYINLMS